MLALFGNLGFGEVVLIAIVSILVFGKRLPEVASQTFRQVAKLRRNLDDLRRETGIDRELRDVRGALTGLSRDLAGPPPGLPTRPTLQAREEPRTVTPEPPLTPPPAAPSPPPEEAAGEGGAPRL